MLTANCEVNARGITLSLYLGDSYNLGIIEAFCIARFEASFCRPVMRQSCAFEDRSSPSRSWLVEHFDASSILMMLFCR